MGHETDHTFQWDDGLRSFLGILQRVFMASAGLTALASFRYLDREKLQLPEYYILILFSALGMMLMASALDLIVVFIALEIMSLSVYTLVGFRRADRRSNEAAMKYFILGSAASAIMLYGAALLYGTTGSMNIHEIFKFVQANPAGTFTGLRHRRLACDSGLSVQSRPVPFHMWMPDVYEGAPTPVTGFMTILFFWFPQEYIIQSVAFLSPLLLSPRLQCFRVCDAFLFSSFGKQRNEFRENW